MKEMKTKELVQQSVIKTSEGFTDDLMDKIQEQKSARPLQVKWWPAVAAYLAVLFVGILVSQMTWEYTFLTGAFKRLSQVLLSLFLIFSFYRFFLLKKKMATLRR